LRFRSVVTVPTCGSFGNNRPDASRSTTPPSPAGPRARETARRRRGGEACFASSRRRTRADSCARGQISTRETRKRHSK
jgi:hypothetical protein